MDRTLVLAVSDFHMGFGVHPAGACANVHEDFHRDFEFVRLLEHYRTCHSGTDLRLVFNGDFLDVLLNGTPGRYGRPTARTALDLVQRAVSGHQEVFAALGRFNERPGRAIHFVVGNHDPDLLLPGVQRVLRERIGGSVAYHPTHFELGDLLIEHGHLYDVVNGYDPAKLWPLGLGNDAIFSPPVGTILARGVVVPLKDFRPLLHKIKPVDRYMRWVLAHDPVLCGRMLWAFLRTAFCHVVGRERGMADRFYHLARRNVRRILRLNRFHLFESIARVLLRTGGYSTVVFGHTHRPVDVEVDAGKRYINTGTWSEVLRMNGRAIEPDTSLAYARVVLENGRCVESRLAAWN